MTPQERSLSQAASSAWQNPYLLLALAGLCWSGNHIIGRAMAGHVPPLAISMLRWIFPAVLLWLFARPYIKKDWPLIWRHRVLIVLLSVSGGGVFGALQFVGLQFTTAVNVAVFNSVPPVLIAAAGALIFRDRLLPAQVAGIAISLAGVLVVVTRADLTVLTQMEFNRGDIIILSNMVLWSGYSACLRLLPPVHWQSFLFVFAAISSIATIPFFLWEHLSGYTLQPTLLTFGALSYISLFTSLFAYLFWNRGVEQIGANRAGVFLHLIPVYGAVLATVFLGERLMAYHVLGFTLILSGVWLAGRRAAVSHKAN
jgi:drug/metabolite transporter (DMT)-like permease